MELRIIAGVFEAMGLGTIGYSVANALGAGDRVMPALADQTWFWVGVVLALLPVVALLSASRRDMRTVGTGTALPDYVMLDCPTCGSTVRSDAQECRYCGATLR